MKGVEFPVISYQPLISGTWAAMSSGFSTVNKERIAEHLKMAHLLSEGIELEYEFHHQISIRFPMNQMMSMTLFSFWGH